jgi:CDP-diacylglycerol pyrophosphatase
VTEDENADGLRRRQFIKLSGVAGAAAVFGGYGAGARANLLTRGTLGSGGGANLLCGDDLDKDDIWQSAQECGKAFSGGHPAPNGCMGTTKYDVVLNGRPKSDHNFLLVPTHRIKGIECQRIWDPHYQHYYPLLWKDAWVQAQKGGAGEVKGGAVGLGINSKPDRRLEQLHIHMARVRSMVPGQLDKQRTAIASHPSAWDASIVEVTGVVKVKGKPQPDTRYYRALLVPKTVLSTQNLFALLRDNVSAARADMGKQMMLVTRSALHNDFYVLNSDPQCRPPNPKPGQGGTGACDPLLVYD